MINNTDISVKEYAAERGEGGIFSGKKCNKTLDIEKTVRNG